MSNAWETAGKRAETGGGPSIFIRLADDGEKFVGQFCGEPHVRELVWNEKKNAYEDFSKEHEALGKKSSPRFAINVFVPGEKAMRVFEMNNSTFKDVIKVRDKYKYQGNGETERTLWFFEVERKGKKGDTKTTYSILPESAVDDELMKLSVGSKLHDLAKVVKSDEGDAQTDMNSHDKKKDGKANAAQAPSLIDDATRAALTARLKILPKEKIDAFLGKFAVQQVKSLKANEVDAAKAMLDELEGKKPEPAAAAPAEVDPFA